MRLPKNHEKWHLKSNPKKVALVMWCRKDEDPEWPTLLRGYVMLKAPWFRRGTGAKSLDTFVKQFEPHNAYWADSADQKESALNPGDNAATGLAADQQRETRTKK